MKTLPRAEADVVWNKLWPAIQSEWFKVEVLQDYSGEDNGDSLSAWMAGDKKKSIELIQLMPSDWLGEMRKKTENGVIFTRIHVVDYPLSEYVQWEIEVYKNRNIPLGKENVFLLDRKDISEVILPEGDMMIFDKTDVVVNTYDESGYAVSKAFYLEGDETSYFMDLRSKLLSANLKRVG